MVSKRRIPPPVSGPLQATPIYSTSLTCSITVCRHRPSYSRHANTISPKTRKSSKKPKTVMEGVCLSTRILRMGIAETVNGLPQAVSHCCENTKACQANHNLVQKAYLRFLAEKKTGDEKEKLKMEVKARSVGLGPGWLSIRKWPRIWGFGA